MNRGIKKSVYEVLDSDELALTDDYYLIFKVLYKMNPFAYSTPFMEVLNGAKYQGISFESITRARRKYFKEHPELNPKEIRKIRNEERKKYIEEYGGKK